LIADQRAFINNYVWHLHGCNTHTTATLCILRLIHSKLNNDDQWPLQSDVSCGAIQTKDHLVYLNALLHTLHVNSYYQGCKRFLSYKWNCHPVFGVCELRHPRAN